MTRWTPVNELAAMIAALLVGGLVFLWGWHDPLSPIAFLQPILLMLSLLVYCMALDGSEEGFAAKQPSVLAIQDPNLRSLEIERLVDSFAFRDSLYKARARIMLKTCPVMFGSLMTSSYIGAYAIAVPFIVGLIYKIAYVMIPWIRPLSMAKPY